MYRPMRVGSGRSPSQDLPCLRAVLLLDSVSGRFHGQADINGRARRPGGTDLDSTPMVVNHAAGNRQAQPAAGNRGPWTAVELPEDLLAFLSRNAIASVGDPDVQVAVFRVGFDRQRLASRRVLDRVVDHVLEHLKERLP